MVALNAPQTIGSSVSTSESHLKKLEEELKEITCTPTFTAPSLTVTKLWKQPTCERVNKMWYFHPVMTQSVMSLGDIKLNLKRPLTSTV